MRKKVFVLILCSIVCAFLLSACAAKEVSGNVESVVEKCQQVANNEKVTVTVTGSLAAGQDISSGSFILIDGSSYKYYAYVNLKDGGNTSKAYGRITVKGTLNNKLTTDTAVHISDAQIVD